MKQARPRSRQPCATWPSSWSPTPASAAPTRSRSPSSTASEFNVDVRKGQIENLVEAGSRSAGLRVIKDKKTAFASSSDLDEGDAPAPGPRTPSGGPSSANPDEFAGLAPLVDRARRRRGPRPLRSRASPGSIPRPRSAWPSRPSGSLCATSGSPTPTGRLRSERDPLGPGHFATAFSASTSRPTAAWASASRPATRTIWSRTPGHRPRRHLQGPRDRPRPIARKAVERTVRQLNPRKIKTQNVPVIFEPDP